MFKMDMIDQTMRYLIVVVLLQLSQEHKKHKLLPFDDLIGF